MSKKEEGGDSRVTDQ